MSVNSVILCLILFILNVSGELCDDRSSVDLTGGRVYHDGKIVKDGIIYPPYYVYERNVNGVIKSFGCVCKIKRCFRKCCPLGSVFKGRNCTESVSDDIIMNQGINVNFMVTYQKTVDMNSSYFTLVYGKPGSVYKEVLPWYLQQDGKLFVETAHQVPPWTIYEPDKYCIDTFIHNDENGNTVHRLDALVCFPEDKQSSNHVLSSTCMLISCVFIIATVAVYMWLPELRNLHGRVLIVYLLCFFVGFLLMALMQILQMFKLLDENSCLGMTVVIYFSLMSAFFWLNVMSFDIWWTFSGNQVQSAMLHKRFCKYAIYAFGIPTAFTIILVSLQFSGLPPNPWLPLLRPQGCFLHGKSRLLYLYGPMAILCCANLTFFIFTAWKIIRTDRQSKVLKSNESSRHDQHKNDKQRLLLYIKLFAVMGVNWILEMVSSLYPEIQMLWNFTDAYNVLVGFIVFVIFVCKKKIFRLLKKRYRQVRGEPMSRSQTTVTSRTACSRDYIRMNSVKSVQNKY